MCVMPKNASVFLEAATPFNASVSRLGLRVGMKVLAYTCYLTILVLLAGAAPARGTVIQIRFAGVIEFVDGGVPFEDAVAVGTQFVGTYAYDSGIPDNSPVDPVIGSYLYPDSMMEVRIGDLEFATSGFGISVFNSNPPLPDDYSVFNLSSFHANGVDWGRMVITLRDATGLAFANDSLPDYAPDLADFEFQTLFYLQQVGLRDPLVTGQITSLEVVPEPGALVLFAAGSLLAMWRSNRRTQMGEAS